MKPVIESPLSVHQLSQPFRFLYRLWYFLVVLPTFVLLATPLLGAASYALSYVNIRWSVYMGVLWAKYSLWISMIRAQVYGSENIDPTQSYVVVVNHESNLDIVGLYGFLPVDFRWVMKIEIRKIPILGPACERMKHVFIDRSNREKAIESLQRAKSQLTNGTSILFFPEGTRNNKPEMLPFKKGAFRMAIDLQLPVLPVTLRNTGVLLPNNSVEARPGTLELVIHKPIPVENLTIDDTTTLMAQARESIQSAR